MAVWAGEKLKAWPCGPSMNSFTGTAVWADAKYGDGHPSPKRIKIIGKINTSIANINEDQNGLQSPPAASLDAPPAAPAAAAVGKICMYCLIK